MKERTDDEVWEKVHELWPEAEGHGHGWSDYFAVERKDDYLDIVVAKMYSDDIPQLTFDHIQALA